MPTIIDLSHPLRPGMPVWPGDPETRFDRHLDPGAAGCLVHSVTVSTHAGTHLDAPAHWLGNGATVETRSILEACIGEAYAFDVSRIKEGGCITPADLGDRVDLVGPGARVLLASGWDVRFGSPDFFERFPSLSDDLARLLAGRRIALLGLDTPALHTGRDEELHRLLLSEGVAIVENLANLLLIAGKRVFFSAAPLALAGLDGSPVRAYAAVDEEAGFPQ